MFMSNPGTSTNHVGGGAADIPTPRELRDRAPLYSKFMNNMNSPGDGLIQLMSTDSPGGGRYSSFNS